MLGLGWDAVKELHKEALKKKYQGTYHLGKLSISLSMISDLKTGKVIHVVEGRRKEDINPFLKKLKKSPLLKTICMDLSKSYTAVVKKILLQFLVSSSMASSFYLPCMP